MAQQIIYSENCMRVVKTTAPINKEIYPSPAIQHSRSRLSDIATFRNDRNYKNPYWFVKQVVNW